MGHPSAIPGLVANASRPAERWFLAIRRGHTPENSEVARITEQWIVEWLKGRGIDARAKIVVETYHRWRNASDLDGARFRTRRDAREALGKKARLVHIRVSRMALPKDGAT